MDRCVVCGFPLSVMEKDLLIDFHSKCSKTMIAMALEMLERSGIERLAKEGKDE